MLRFGEDLYPFSTNTGDELLVPQTNRDFSVDEGDWVAVGTGASIAYDAVNDELDITVGNAFSGTRILSPALTEDRLYKIELTVSNLSAGYIIMSDSVNTTVYATPVEEGSHVIYITAVSGDAGLKIRGSSGGSTFSIDNLSIKEFVDINWVPLGTNTLEIDGDALKVIYSNNAAGANGELTVLTDGEKYSIAFEAKGDTCKVKTDSDETDDITSEWASYELVHTHNTGDNIYFSGLGAGESAYIKNIVIKRVVVSGMILVRSDFSEDFSIDGVSALVRLPWSEDYNLLTRQPLSEVYEDEDGEVYTRLDYSEDFQTETLKFVRQPNSEDYLVEAR